MVKSLFKLICILSINLSFSQSKDSTAVKYLEDQFYLNLTYNILNYVPMDFNARGLSNGISFGHINDIPFNKKRNFGLGIGLGYGRNTYYQNVKISKQNNATFFEVLGENVSFERNKFSMHAIELPFELRWRTSTATVYKFWRVYPGIKFSYIVASNAKLKQGTKTKINGIDEINKFQYGLTLSAGYGTWNVNVYYGLRDLFSNALISTTNEPLTMRDIRIGLIFYIL